MTEIISDSFSVVNFLNRVNHELNNKKTSQETQRLWSSLSDFKLLFFKLLTPQRSALQRLHTHLGSFLSNNQ